MRIIDADALKESLFDLVAPSGIIYASDMESLIDNAPTIERPQGEWLEPFEYRGKTYHKCTHCHISSELILIDNFCPNCGADMRGEEE